MMKKLLLAVVLSLVASSAFAACTNPLPILNGSTASVNMSVGQNTADAGCMYNVTPMQGGAPLSATNPSYGAITDGTNGPVAVKPASTAATAPDKSAVVQLNPLSPGIIAYVDPCQNPGILKSSVAINVSTATTTALVPVSGSTAVYVCSFSLVVAGSATTANSAKFEYGSGTACATSPTSLTGTFGSNDAAVSTAPTVINQGGGASVMTAPSGNGLCLVTAGNAPFDQGILTYVQQ